MRPALAPLVALVLLLPALALPTSLSAPGLPAADGLVNACSSSENEQPCRKARIIYSTTVTNGTTRTYTGNYLAVGTVVVESGATVIFDNAFVTFNASSGGVIARDGGTLRVEGSVFTEERNGSAYQIVGERGASLAFVHSNLSGGGGMLLQTDAANVTSSSFAHHDVALRLLHVNLTIAANTFWNSSVSVNLTGGRPTLERNRFDGGEVCVRDWRTNPTIVHNVFRGCHVGIWHEQSHSFLTDNDMEDRAEPPGSGIIVIGGLSPVVERNTIRNYGTGILIVDARAYVRNNTVEGNVGDGIRVVRNAAEMDIQGNRIAGNGGHGIRLVEVADLPVFGNTVVGNGGDGIRVEDSPGARIDGNGVHDNAGDGIVVTSGSPRAQLVANDVRGSGRDGIVVRAHEVAILGGASSGNAGHGVALLGALGVRIENATANANGLSGVHMGASRAQLRSVNASLNGQHGFLYDPMGPIQLLGQTDLVGVRALFNGGSGLHNVAGNATFARNAWWEGNMVAGVHNADLASVIDARESYWGSPTGPRHVANPGGTGDAVVGGVVYVPFLTAPPGSAGSAG